MGAAMKTKIGRNDPCPCGSGRKVKKCCGVDVARAYSIPDAMHFMVEGQLPTPEQVAEMKAELQRRIKDSELWPLMVDEYGEERALELLAEFGVDVHR